MEYLIALHCSPALSGIKPSNMINCKKEDYPHLKSEIARLNKRLGKRGIHIDIICECAKNYLIMVYREKSLCEYLRTEEIKNFLLQYGYPDSGSAEGYLKRLKERLAENNGFPHEIGAFLGYPISDIYGFINKSTSVCLYTGYWKVYSNLEESKEKFRRYDKCRAAVLKRMELGQDLPSIFCA